MTSALPSPRESLEPSPHFCPQAAPGRAQLPLLLPAGKLPRESPGAFSVTPARRQPPGRAQRFLRHSCPQATPGEPRAFLLVTPAQATPGRAPGSLLPSLSCPQAAPGRAQRSPSLLPAGNPPRASRAFSVTPACRQSPGEPRAFSYYPARRHPGRAQLPVTPAPQAAPAPAEAVDSESLPFRRSGTNQGQRPSLGKPSTSTEILRLPLNPPASMHAHRCTHARISLCQVTFMLRAWAAGFSSRASLPALETEAKSAAQPPHQPQRSSEALWGIPGRPGGERK